MSKKRLSDREFYSETPYYWYKEYKELLNKNEQLKQRIKSRLHYYRELYDSTNNDIVKKVIEDLEDVLKE